ncbi:MAG TPA: immunoglobulin domain-containing protein [Opitutaceae bacterium]|nr:immunoglobulin domain-containing protein [Opitutaceae bacterium]
MNYKAAATALLLTLSSGYAQTVTTPPNPTTITVSPSSTVRTLDPRFYGVNITMWDSLLRIPQTDTYLKQVKFGTMRLPGGSLSDDYDWATNKQIQGNPNWTWTNSIPDMAKVAEAQNATMYVTVNYGSGTPEMAAALVAYLNGAVTNGQTIGKDDKGRDWETVSYWAKLRGSSPVTPDDGKNFLRIAHPQPFKVKYFEVGNENYGSWEYDQHGVNNSGLLGAKNDPFTYAQSFKDFKAKMLAVDPSIKIGAVTEAAENLYGIGTHGVQNPRTLTLFTGWTPVMLANFKATGVYPDFLSYHYYAQNPPNENDNTLMQKNVDLGTKAAAIRQMITDYIGTANGHDIELVMTEINSVSSAPGRQSSNLVNGLFYADSYGTIAQSEFNTVIWWDLHNGSEDPAKVNMSTSLYGWRNFGTYNMIAGVSTATEYPGVPSHSPLPTFYAAKLLTHWAQGGDQIIKTVSNYAWLSAYGAKQANGKIALLVVNKNPTINIGAEVDIPGLSGSAAATIYTYNKTIDAGAADQIDVQTSTMPLTTPKFTYTFPSYSMTVIQLDTAPTVPVITTQPTSTSAVLGGGASFSVVAAGSGTLTYQWYRNGVALGGENSATLNLVNITENDFGSYTVKISNSLGSVTSAPVTLSLSTAYLSNVSMRAAVASGEDTPIVGVVVGGSGSAPILVRADGPILSKYDVTNFLPDPQLEIFDDGSHSIAKNNDWSATIAADMSAYGAFALDAGSKDAALIQDLGAGHGYTAKLEANAGTGVGLLEMYSAGGGSARLVNVSARARSGAGENVLIAGFVIAGTGQMKVLIRGLGPKLTDYGLTSFLADPTIEVHSSSAIVATNDNWDTGDGAADTAAAIAKVKATDLKAGSKDAALAVSLVPGAYTVVVRGVNGTTGVAIAEVYEVP